MHHLSAYYESVDPGGALIPIAAVNDPVLFTDGDDVRVPTALPNIIGKACLQNDASPLRAQIQSPSLRSFVNVDVEPIVQALVWGSPPEATLHPLSPIPVTPDEAVNFYIMNTGGDAQVHQGFIWYSEGALQPTPGRIFSVYATSAITLAAGVWVNGNLTFGSTLPQGDYQVVGLRARGTNLVAARLVFVGGTWRPGVMAVNAIADEDVVVTRFGRMGVWGQFNTNTPPTVECMGVTDSAQVYIIDLIRV